MQSLKRVSGLLARQGHNFRVMLAKRAASSFAAGLTQNYASIYVVKLGADPVQLGSLNSIGSLVSSLLAAPIGWLADSYSLRRVYLACFALSLLAPLAYVLANDWRVAVIPIIIAYVNMGSTMMLETILMANSLRDGDRATGFGLAYTASGLAAVTAPAMAGFLLKSLGGLTTGGMRLLFTLQLITTSAVFLWVMANLEDSRLGRDSGGDGFIQGFRAILGNKAIHRWLAVETLGSFIFGTVEPFTAVYAAEIKGADALTLGLMGSALNLSYMLASLPVGRLADRIGRKKTIVLLRPALYASMLLIVFAPDPRYLILAFAFRGLVWGSMGAWSSLRMELVGAEQRGRWTGVISMLRGLARTPAPLVGGLLWFAVSPAAPFLMLVAVDVTTRLPLILSMPETLRRSGS